VAAVIRHLAIRFLLRPLLILTVNVFLKGLQPKYQYPRIWVAEMIDELIRNRVVHAKAAGAWGEFEVTNDISALTSAKFLNGVGKKTPVLFRLSGTGGEKGSADTVRDVRGFSVKFFTEDGNHDIVGNHIVSLSSSPLEHLF
jgi:hypothetical protein